MRDCRCSEMEEYFTLYQLWFTLPTTMYKQIMMGQAYFSLYLTQQRFHGPQWRNCCMHLSHLDSINYCCKALHLKCYGGPSYAFAKYWWLMMGVLGPEKMLRNKNQNQEKIHVLQLLLRCVKHRISCACLNRRALYWKLLRTPLIQWKLLTKINYKNSEN